MMVSTFLGWNFRKYKGRLIIKPSWNSIKSISLKIKTIVKKAQAWTQNLLYQDIEPSNHRMGKLSSSYCCIQSIQQIGCIHMENHMEMGETSPLEQRTQMDYAKILDIGRRLAF